MHLSRICWSFCGTLKCFLKAIHISELQRKNFCGYYGLASRIGQISVTLVLKAYLNSGLKYNFYIQAIADLCVIEGEISCIFQMCWVLYCDLICLNYDGNLLDACILALVSALCNSKSIVNVT